MPDHILSEQEIVRREELRELKALGIDPYPAEAYHVDTFAADVKSGFKSHPERFSNIQLAGRLLTKRVMGKAAFADLQDETGSIQIYLARDAICPDEDKTLYNTVFKKLISTGDIIGVSGSAFTTQTGELTIEVTDFKLLSKALRQPPMPKEKDGEIYDAFTDPEQRHRMRYVDLFVNPATRETFRKRTQLIKTMRDFLNNKGYLEVETPILQPVYGGALARPFTTHHNALDMQLYLRIANELYLKKLIVGGFTGVYEFAKDFRNEGMSRFHNPEFTQIELYVAYEDYRWMMDTVEEMLEAVAAAVHGSTDVPVGEHTLNFRRPFARKTFFGAIEEFAGHDLRGKPLEDIRQAARELGIEEVDTLTKAGLLDEIFGEVVEPHLLDPTFIMDYPLEMSPLAKTHRSEEGLVERFELVANGKEIANAYTELNDPMDQRQRLEQQLQARNLGDEEAMVLDEDFLRALEYGMPPTTGLGIGIDRLTMILTNQPTIQEVLLFPHMRPEPKADISDKEAFYALGIPAEWLPLVIREGIRHPWHLHGKQAGQLYKSLNSARKQLNLTLPELTKEHVQAWIDSAPEPPAEEDN